MDATFALNAVTTREELQDALGGEPRWSLINSVRSRLTEVDRRWLAGSPFCLLATSGADGSCDVSPRGDEPGFALVLSDTTIALPERAGNRRGDGYANLLENGHVGLLFMIPGRTDTLRINGRALLVRDGPFFDQMAVDGRRPVLAAVIEVEEIFYHCTKAFHRSGLWRRERRDRDVAPSRAEVAQALGADLPPRFGAVALDEEYAQERCAL